MRRSCPQIGVCRVYPRGTIYSAYSLGWDLGIDHFADMNWYHVCLTAGDPGAQDIPGRFRWNILEDKFQGCNAQPLRTVVGSIRWNMENLCNNSSVSLFSFRQNTPPMFLGRILLNPNAPTWSIMANSIFSSSNAMHQQLLASDRNLPAPTSSPLSSWNGTLLRRPKYLDLNLIHSLGSSCVFKWYPDHEFAHRKRHKRHVPSVSTR